MIRSAAIALRALAVLALLVGGLVAAHFALIELPYEVATLVTRDPDGTPRRTRLWIVDAEGPAGRGPVAWLHSGGADWASRFREPRRVRIERPSGITCPRAVAVPGPHPEVDRLLREKYGIADRWVRFLSPDRADTLAVRLEPASACTPDDPPAANAAPAPLRGDPRA